VWSFQCVTEFINSASISAPWWWSEVCVDNSECWVCKAHMYTRTTSICSAVVRTVKNIHNSINISVQSWWSKQCIHREKLVPQLRRWTTLIHRATVSSSAQSQWRKDCAHKRRIPNATFAKRSGEALYTVSWDLIPPGGGVEYLHRSLASRRRRRKGNPAPRGITGQSYSWGV
jgi:hypothetical protein